MNAKEQDNKAFVEAMSKAGVSPTKQKQRVFSKVSVKKSVKLMISLQNPTSQTAFSSLLSAQTQELSYGSNKVSKKVWQDLKRGKYPIIDELDLHGYKVEEARRYLEVYFSENRQGTNQSQKEVVRIIHGKGTNSPQNLVGTLKYHVAHWLPQIPQARAFCSCPIADGGAGAVYVLLDN